MAFGSPRTTLDKTGPVPGGRLTPILILDGTKIQLSHPSGIGSSWNVLVDNERVALEILEETTTNRPTILVRSGGRVLRISAKKLPLEDAYSVELNGRSLVARLEEETTIVRSDRGGSVEGPVLVTSPMAGKIASVKTSLGASVEEGQALVVLEAMKMENEIAAPRRGIVKEIYIKQGALAKPGDKLVLIE